MEINWVTIVFIIFIVDAIGANLLVWTLGESWWQKHLAPIARYIPLTKRTAALYLALVLLVGIILKNNGILVVPF